MKKVLIVVLCIAGFWALIKYSLFTHAERCTELESEVRTTLSTLQSCNSDSDCDWIRLSCPFDCQTIVARSGIDQALAAYGKYTRECMFVCPECPKPTPLRPRCVTNRCVHPDAIIDTGGIGTGGMTQALDEE